MVRVAVALVLAATAACGDNVEPDILLQLRALPSVADATELPTQDAHYRYIQVHFIQPVDHAKPGGATFLQEASLLHRDQGAPLVVETSGYWDYILDNPVELTRVVDGNQISIEHRFFGTSRPAPADWSTLTIAQMADDEHAIVDALRSIYHAPIVASGASKGGMTSMFYRRFFPEDVAGTVPYVAPISFGAPDERYPPYLATIGPSDCHAAVQAAATEMLANRRSSFESLAAAEAIALGDTYTRVAIGPAVESAIDSLEWAFWQYLGVASCSSVPATTASDNALYAFLDQVSPVYAASDAQLALFEAYEYQADEQLGFPDPGTSYLTPYLKYGDADYAGVLPVGVPEPSYDGGAAMNDVAQFVATMGDQLLFVYGEWDPWSGGAYALGRASSSLELVEVQGTHASDLAHLASTDGTRAASLLGGWTHQQLAAVSTIAARAVQREPHPPIAALHALHRLRRGPRPDTRGP